MSCILNLNSLGVDVVLLLSGALVLLFFSVCRLRIYVFVKRFQFILILLLFVVGGGSGVGSCEISGG